VGKSPIVIRNGLRRLAAGVSVGPFTVGKVGSAAARESADEGAALSGGGLAGGSTGSVLAGAGGAAPAPTPCADADRSDVTATTSAKEQANANHLIFERPPIDGAAPPAQPASPPVRRTANPFMREMVAHRARPISFWRWLSIDSERVPFPSQVNVAKGQTRSARLLNTSMRARRWETGSLSAASTQCFKAQYRYPITALGLPIHVAH
jgi:hypothetical protein